MPLPCPPPPSQVLRIDPEAWEESGTVHDTTLGKRCARL